jgi:hypothetical protein
MFERQSETCNRRKALCTLSSRFVSPRSRHAVDKKYRRSATINVYVIGGGVFFPPLGRMRLNALDIHIRPKIVENLGFRQVLPSNEYLPFLASQDLDLYQHDLAVE